MQCPLCHKLGVKRFKSHLKASHAQELEALFAQQPEARQAFEQASSEQLVQIVSPQQSPEQPEASPQDEQPETAPSSGVESAVIKALDQVDFEGMMRKVAHEEVTSQLNKLAEQGQQQQMEQPQAGGGSQITQFLAAMNALKGGTDSQGQIAQMTGFAQAMGQAMASMAAPLFNAYAQGQAMNFNQLKMMGQFGINPFEVKNEGTQQSPERNE